jgi:hypothetical protein
MVKIKLPANKDCRDMVKSLLYHSLGKNHSTQEFLFAMLWIFPQKPATFCRLLTEGLALSGISFSGIYFFWCPQDLLGQREIREGNDTWNKVVEEEAKRSFTTYHPPCVEKLSCSC